MRFFLAALLLAGCLPDLGGYAVGERRDAGPRPDVGPGVDGGGPGVDGGGGGDDCAPAPTCVGGCPRPWLLATVEDLPGGAECGGRVLRWSLGSREEACLCGALDAAGGLPTLPRTLGFVPPETVVVAAQDGVVAIDARDDSVAWNSPGVGMMPRDVFPMEDLDGGPLAAIAWSNPGFDDIRVVHAHGRDSGRLEHEWQTNGGELPVGLGVVSMSASPFDPQHVRTLKINGGWAAADADPYTRTLFDDPVHTVSRDGFFLQTISAFHWDGTYRVVWTGERTDVSPRRSEVYTYRSTTVRVDNRVPLGDTCDEGPDALPYGATCEFVHAVPHPLHDTDLFAICSWASGERRVLRMEHISQTCHDLIEQRDVFDSARITRLAIALDDYWDAL